MDTFIHYGMAAGMQAIQDSGLVVTEENAERIGVIVGSGIGGLPMIEETHSEYTNRGPRRISPFFVPASIINMISGHLSIKYGLKGPNLAIVTACTTGLHCIGEAGRLIEYGDADVMIAGGAESTVSPLGVGGFAAARALSARNDDPATASRPWDKDRDGFVMGEGAAIFVLEEWEHAVARGAVILGEILGAASNADAHHITAPAPGGVGAIDCMQMVIDDAGLRPDQITYVNAHGTSTPRNDEAEAAAIRAVFGADQPAVTSIKGVTGHALGAAGALEAASVLLSMRHGSIPPTAGTTSLDDDVAIDVVIGAARPWTPAPAMSNNFGFGGHNGSIILGPA